MRLVNFILGVLGVLLIIGAFSSFLPLVFLGGIATGSVAFAFGLPILLIVIGAAMVYFGFYYTGSRNESNGEVGSIVKWGIICTIAILISNFVIDKLLIVNPFWAILVTAIILSIIVQAVRSHDREYTFKMKWFIFYFLVYATILWVMATYVLPKLDIQTGLFSSLVVGFTLAGVFIILKKMNLNSSSILWISVVLILILVVANMGDLQKFNIPKFTESSFNSSGVLEYSPILALSEDKQKCPTAVNTTWRSTPSLYKENFYEETIGFSMNTLINLSVWKIEKGIGSCYKGHYEGQNPNWFYCTDMVVSRWDLSSAGTINYRWYTMVTFEWSPISTNVNTPYLLQGLSCENGEAFVVKKGESKFYFKDSRDGTPINIEVSGDETPVNLQY